MDSEATQTFIVTLNHNQDYVSSTVFLTRATSHAEAVIQCMDYDREGFGFDEDEKQEYQDKLNELRGLDWNELTQYYRDGGDVWDAEVFTMPALDGTQVVQIAKLDSD